ncbi:sperm tail domain-containing protein [Phthorimaea operculella]|nr:sperm tail domain-containing protein [Phthorimaea operculella]
MNRYDDEEEDVLAPKEPQVTSNDPEERKAARWLRIQRRQEAIRKSDNPPEEVIPEEEMGIVELATTRAAEELQRIILDGTYQVTNVRVFTDEREVDRRNANQEKMTKLFEEIEAEAEETQQLYESVAENWEAMMSIKDPLDIDAAIKEQKVKADELLQRKTNLIDQLKADLHIMDLQYHEDLLKQDADIKELSARIEKQLAILQKAYETQLGLIEESLNIERDNIIDHNNKRWDALYKQRDKEEQIHIDQKMEQLEEHKEKMEQIMWDHYEKYREAKIQLETLIQELQKELEKLKATCLINTEKIGYNYQILKKREEENLFVRSQQKRKLNKLTDVVNEIRAKIRKAAEEGAQEEIKADLEIKKLMRYMNSLEKKAYQFANCNNYKFMQVWRMAVNRCTEMVKDFRQSEIVLHAHVLAEPPPPPPPDPPKNPLAKIASEMGLDVAKTNVTDAVKDSKFGEAKEKLVRHILQLVADNTGFLVEDRLLKLIEKYQQKPRNLCTLDAIFMALEIQTQEDIELLAETFLAYAFCPICVGLENEPTDGGPSDVYNNDTASVALRQSRAASSVRAHASIAMARSMSTNTSRSGHVGFRAADLSPEDQLLVQEADEILAKCGDCQAPTLLTGAASEAGGVTRRQQTARGVTVTTPQPTVMERNNPFVCDEGHQLEIEPMQVLTALGEFITKFVPPEKKKLMDILDSVKPPCFDTPSRRLTNKEIEEYWAQWRNIYPVEKDRLWSGVVKGLKDYLAVLQGDRGVLGAVAEHLPGGEGPSLERRRQGPQGLLGRSASTNMEQIKESMEFLAASVHSRMAAFEEELKKDPTKKDTVNSIATEFQSFRTFVVASLGALQKQIGMLTDDLDAMEMRTRRKMLLLHGVPEEKDEDTIAVVVTVVNEHLSLPELNTKTRDDAWMHKVGLKGTGITVSEFLTPRRHRLFKAAHLKFGVTKCWTREGRIIYLAPDGKRHTISSRQHLETLACDTAGDSSKQTGIPTSTGDSKDMPPKRGKVPAGKK